MIMTRGRKIGLALGSGSSRGWSHIGIIKALAGIGIEPDIVCGTSIGSLVGASYVSGNLHLKEFSVVTIDLRFVWDRKVKSLLLHYLSSLSPCTPQGHSRCSIPA